jgi:hypothetical protein
MSTESHYSRAGVKGARSWRSPRLAVLLWVFSFLMAFAYAPDSLRALRGGASGDDWSLLLSTVVRGVWVSTFSVSIAWGLPLLFVVLRERLARRSVARK